MSLSRYCARIHDRLDFAIRRLGSGPRARLNYEKRKCWSNAAWAVQDERQRARRLHRDERGHRRWLREQREEEEKEQSRRSSAPGWWDRLWGKRGGVGAYRDDKSLDAERWDRPSDPHLRYPSYPDLLLPDGHHDMCHGRPYHHHRRCTVHRGDSPASERHKSGYGDDSPWRYSDSRSSTTTQTTRSRRRSESFTSHSSDDYSTIPEAAWSREDTAASSSAGTSTAPSSPALVPEEGGQARARGVWRWWRR
jgi:hypothetical protein